MASRWRRLPSCPLAACRPRRRERGCQYSLELAIEISLTSLGSSHTFLIPQLRTEAASRFCSLRDTILPLRCYNGPKGRERDVAGAPRVAM